MHPRLHYGGMRRNNDCMHYLAEIKLPPIIYLTTTDRFNRSIKLKNGMKDKQIYEGPVVRMIFNPVRWEGTVLVQ